MSISNAYCRKHDEIEPQDCEELWVCPKCARDNFYKSVRRKQEGPKQTLEEALAEIDRKFGSK